MENNVSILEDVYEINTLFDKLTEYFNEQDRKKLLNVIKGIIQGGVFLNEVKDYMRENGVKEESIPTLTKMYEKYLWGYSKLEVLLEDESISDIRIKQHDKICIKRYGRRGIADVRFNSKEEYRKFIDRVVLINKINKSDSNAEQTFTDKKSNDKFLFNRVFIGYERNLKIYEYTMCEMYVMQQYLQKDTLEQMGIYHFDSWATNFGEVTTALELTVEGSGFRFKSRFNKFTNLPELMNIFRECADVQTADMLDLDVPALRDNKYIIAQSKAD